MVSVFLIFLIGDMKQVIVVVDFMLGTFSSFLAEH